MTKKNLKNRKIENIRKIKLWLAAFIPFIVSSVLFVFCFIYESALWLYIICIAVFLSFVILYIRADKEIMQKDGYTLLQAIHFHLVCLRNNIDFCASPIERRRKINEIAKQYDYSSQLEANQIELMNNIGQELVTHFKLERFSKYV